MAGNDGNLLPIRYNYISQKYFLDKRFCFSGLLMGSLMSYVWGPSVPDNYDVPDEALGLTLRDKDLVRKSWEMILKKGVRPMGISLFKMYVLLLIVELLTIALI